MSNPKNFYNKIQPHCPPKTACKTADTLMPGVNSKLQPKKANPHPVHQKLFFKTKTLLTFGMTLKLPAKNTRSQQLTKEAEFVWFPEAHNNKRSRNFVTKSSHQLRLQMLFALKNCHQSTENKLLNQKLFATCPIKMRMVVLKEKRRQRD